VFAGIAFAFSACVTTLTAQESSTKGTSAALYQQANAPTESRVDDLLGRMTLEEKVRQLDMYHGATELMSAQSDGTHATLDAVLLPDKAQALLGSLGAGSIHDLYPTPEQANVIQKWVIEHNRLGIPAIFIEEALLGFNTGTVFPAPLNLAATWNPEIARQTGSVIA
jgi:beta-glucosidase